MTNYNLTDTLQIEVEIAYHKNLKKLEATRIFNAKLLNYADELVLLEENKRKGKGKVKNIVTDEEIKQDLQIMRGRMYDPAVGDIVQVIFTDDVHTGEVLKNDGKEIVIKSVTGEKIKIHVSDTKDGAVEINKL